MFQITEIPTKIKDSNKDVVYLKIGNARYELIDKLSKKYKMPRSKIVLQMIDHCLRDMK